MAHIRVCVDNIKSDSDSVSSSSFLLPRSSNGLFTLHNKGSNALQVLQAAVEFLAHGCWVFICHFLSLSLTLFLSHSLFFFLCLSVCLSVSLSLSLSLFLSLFLSLSIFLFLLRVYLSLYFSICRPCLSFSPDPFNFKNLLFTFFP